MLTWVVIFLVVALIAALFGFTGIARASASIAKVIFFIFLVLFVIALIFMLVGRHSPVATPSASSATPPAVTQQQSNS